MENLRKQLVPPLQTHSLYIEQFLTLCCQLLSLSVTPHSSHVVKFQISRFYVLICANFPTDVFVLQQRILSSKFMLRTGGVLCITETNQSVHRFFELASWLSPPFHKVYL